MISLHTAILVVLLAAPGLGDFYQVRTEAGATPANSPRLHTPNPSLIFLAKICAGSLRLVFARDPGVTDRNAYEFVFTNTRSTLSRIDNSGAKELVSQANSPYLVDCNDYRPLWVTWNEEYNLIRGGRGMPGGEALLEFEDVNFIPVNEVTLFSDGDKAFYQLSMDSVLPLKVVTPRGLEWDRFWMNLPEGTTSAVFRLRACEEAHIGLAAGINPAVELRYEVVIQNARSEIRQGRNGPIVARSDTPNILHCSRTSYFWVSWENGYVEVGTGASVGSQRFMGSRDTTAPSIGAITAASGADPVNWVFGLSPVPLHVTGTQGMPPMVSMTTSGSVFEFELNACRDAALGLSMPNSIRQYDYEIVIGAYQNMQTTLRDINGVPGQDVITANTSQILDCGFYVRFWVSWQRGILQVGQGNAFSNVILSNDTQNLFLSIHSISLFTRMQTQTALWRTVRAGVQQVVSGIPDGGGFPVYSFYTGGLNSVVFRTTACSDAMVTLSEFPDSTRINSYIINIGANDNTKTTIRRAGSAQTDTDVDTPNVLMCQNRWQIFWVRWQEEGTSVIIDFGNGRYVGEKSILSFTYPADQKYSVNSVTFGTANGTSSEGFAFWEVGTPEEPQQSVVTPQMYNHGIVRIFTHGKFFPFSVSTCANASVGLYQDPNRVDPIIPDFEFVVGAGMKRVVIKDGAIEVANAELPDYAAVPMCNRPVQMWVSWSNGFLTIGTGGTDSPQRALANWASEYNFNAISAMSLSGVTEYEAQFIYSNNIGSMTRVKSSSQYTRIWMDVVADTSLVFRVQACGDASLLLSDIRGQSQLGTREFTFGSNENTLTVLRDGQKQIVDSAVTPGILNCDGARFFWVSWKDGLLETGQGSLVGQNTVLTWRDPNPSNIHHYSMKTPTGQTGIWDIPTNQEDSIIFMAPPQYSYSFLRLITTNPVVRFKVRQCRGARIALYRSDSTDDMAYEAVIGANNNISYIERSVADQPPQIRTVSTPDILSCDQFRNFWFSWRGGDFHLGAGDLYRGRFLQWTDPNPVEVHSLALSGSSSVDGDWVLPRAAGREVHVLTGTLTPPRPTSWLTMYGQNSAVFRVKACMQANLILAEVPGVHLYNAYEITLNNTISEIRLRNGMTYTSCGSDVTPNILSCTDYQVLWVTWAEASIILGQGPIIGDNQLVSCNPSNPPGISAMTVDSPRNRQAEWDFSDTQGEMYQFYGKDNRDNKIWVLPAKTNFTFRVRACEDIRIRLFSEAWKETSLLYTFRLGYSKNTQSAIYQGRSNNPAATVLTPGLLNCNEMTSIWVRWANNKLDAGQDTAGVGTFITLSIPPIQVAALTFSTGTSAKTDWQYAHSEGEGITMETRKENSFENIWVPVASTRFMTFGVRSCQPVKVALVQFRGNVRSQVYQLSVNKKTVSLQTVVNGRERTVASSSMRGDNEAVMCEHILYYWVTWEGGVIIAGSGSALNRGRQLLSWQNQNPFPVTAAGVSSPSATAYWEFIRPEGSAYQINTPSVFGYEHLWIRTGQTTLNFRVQACADANLLMSPRAMYDTPNYEVQLGAQSNTKSFIKSSSTIMREAQTPDILQCNTWRTFTVSWEGGNVQVYSGSSYRRRLLSWQDGGPLAVRAVSMSTGWGSRGLWQFDDKEDLTVNMNTMPERFQEPAVRPSKTLFGRNCFFFEVRGCTDAIMTLNKVPGRDTQGDIGIKFGSMGNKYIDITMYGRTYRKAVRDSLDCGKNKQYWVQYFRNKVSIGTGKTARTNEVFAQDLPGPFSVHGVTFSSESVSGASWKITGYCDYYPRPSGLSGGQIAGIVIGVLLGVALIAVIVFIATSQDRRDRVKQIIQNRPSLPSFKKDDQFSAHRME